MTHGIMATAAGTVPGITAIAGAIPTMADGTDGAGVARMLLIPAIETSHGVPVFFLDVLGELPTVAT